MWRVVAYYAGALYAEHAERLKQSAQKFSLFVDVVGAVDLGTWTKNMQFKPTFIKHMLEKWAGQSIVYTDADSVFERYPALFDDLDARPDVNVAVHVLDHTKFRRKTQPPELLSGTIFLRNNPETHAIVDAWIEECRKDPGVWDQVALSRVLKGKRFHVLPERYVCIYDYMASVPDKVIVHYQASRAARRIQTKQPIRNVDPNSIRIHHL